MSAQVISLSRYFQPSGNWTQRELAEFYRVESALMQAGLQLETDRGMTDEGEPWFVFCRGDTGEAFIHFARIDGKYIAVGSALDQIVEGRDFATLIQEILAGQAWVMAKARNRSNVFLHPSALLIAIVGAAFFHSGEAKAAETADHGRTELRRHVLPVILFGSGDKTAPPLDASETAAIVSSVLIEWNRVAPLAPSGRDALPILTAVAADDLAVPPPAAHSAVPTEWTATSATRSDADLSPPPAQPAQPLSSQELAPATVSIPAGVLSTEHVGADPWALDGSSTILAAAELAAPLAITASALVMASSSEAAEIVQSSSLFTGPGAQAALVSPSATLLGLVNHGQHETVSAMPSAPAGGGAPAAGAPNVPTEPGAEPSQPATTDAASLNLLDINPRITAVVLQFAAEVHNLDVAVSGHEIILYDAAIFHALPAGTQLESMTFNFADGSSISLVGTVAELHALHLT